MTQEKIFKFNLINDVLTNFASKYQLSPFLADNKYELFSNKEVEERLNLNELILDMKKEYADFWHIDAKDIPFVKDGLAIFELVNDITKLSGVGYLINEEFKNNKELHIGQKAQYKEFFNLLEHSKKGIEQHPHMPNNILKFEANLSSSYMIKAHYLREIQREDSNGISEEFMAKHTEPTHKDILKGAFTSIAYGIYLNENHSDEILRGFADTTNLPVELMNEPNFKAANITDVIRDFYQSDVKEIDLPRSREGNHTRG